MRPAATAISAVSRRVEDAALGAFDAALASRIADQVVERLIASQLVDRIVDRILAERVIERALDRVFDERRVVDELVNRLIASEELWVLVDAIAKSPAVTDAIARQSVGFADQVAGEVRERSRRADFRLERAARRTFRRRPREGPQPPP